MPMQKKPPFHRRTCPRREAALKISPSSNPYLKPNPAKSINLQTYEVLLRKHRIYLSIIYLKLAPLHLVAMEVELQNNIPRRRRRDQASCDGGTRARERMRNECMKSLEQRGLMKPPKNLLIWWCGDFNCQRGFFPIFSG